MSTDGQGTKRLRKIAEIFNRLSRVHERYRRQTNGRAIAYSERERKFTFAKMWLVPHTTRHNTSHPIGGGVRSNEK